MEAEKQGISISKKTFISTVCVLLAIMIAAGVLTLTLPMGSYERTVTDAGYETVAADSYHVVEGARLPVWRWFTSPFEVLASSDAATAIVIIVFIMTMGGTFLVLEKCDVLKHIMYSIVKRFGDKKYKLLAVVSLVFMLLGSVVGMMEETVPLLPIGVALSVALGWDSLVGMGMSVLSVSFGFAVGTLNVFTVGIAQELAGLPKFSGLLLRLVIFAFVYAILIFFLMRYAKSIEKDPKKSLVYESDSARKGEFTYDPDAALLKDKRSARAARIFVLSFVPVFAYIIAGLFIPGLSDFVIPVMLVLMTTGGIVAAKASGYAGKALAKDFFSGVLSILPATLLIIMAMSVKQILVSGGIMDTILHGAYGLIEGTSPYVCVLMIYLFVLLMEFFISSASAKAFLIMPLLVPLGDLVGLTRQTLVQAYVFGDGFTNMIYPTNAMLLIALGIINVPYGKWLKWSWPLQAAFAVLSCAFLLLAVKLCWGPF